jgi:hypothetical protein
MRLNVHATVSFNSIGYYRYMRANYAALTSPENEVAVHVYCLDQECGSVLQRDGSLASVHTVPFGRGSSGHAQAIEAALARLVPGEINIIADTDVVMLMNEWDRPIVADMMNGSGYGIIGTRLEDINGFSSGTTKYQQYKKKPTTTWMALSPHYDFSRLRVRPDKVNEIEVMTQELSALYNLPVGYVVVKDTGWQIPSYLEENAIPYFALDIVKPTDPAAKALCGTSPYHDEFQWDGVPYLAHQRGSMTHRFRIDPLSVDFYDACDAYLGNPAWAPHATQEELARAKVVDAFRFGKRLVKKAFGRG